MFKVVADERRVCLFKTLPLRSTSFFFLRTVRANEHTGLWASLSMGGASAFFLEMIRSIAHNRNLYPGTRMAKSSYVLISDIW